MTEYLIYKTGKIFGRRFRVWYWKQTGKWYWGVYHLVGEIPWGNDNP